MKTLKRIILASVLPIIVSTPAFCADLVLTNGGQDGFVNEGEYNRDAKAILIGERGFAGVFEFQLKNREKVKKAVLTINVSKIKKEGEFALYHLQAFNNGRVETQDYFATSALVEKKTIAKEGPVEFTVTKYVNEDISGPGEYTSFRLMAVKDGQIAADGFEAEKGCAKITTSR